MKKAKNSKQEPKKHMFDERQIQNYNTNLKDEGEDSQEFEEEEEEEIDLNAVSNAELEAKIRKMKEKLGMAKPYNSSEGSRKESEPQEDEEKSQELDYGQEEDYSQGEISQEQSAEEELDDEDQEFAQLEAETNGQVEDIGDTEIKEKQDLKSKISNLKEAIAQLSQKQKQQPDEQSEYDDKEQYQNKRKKQRKVDVVEDADDEKIALHIPKIGNEIPRGQSRAVVEDNYVMGSRKNGTSSKHHDVSSQFEKESQNAARSIKRTHQVDNSRKNKKPYREETMRTDLDESEYQEESVINREAEDEEDEEEYYDEEEVPIESEADESISRYTAKSRKSRRNGGTKQHNFDAGGYPQYFGDQPWMSPQMNPMNFYPGQVNPMLLPPHMIMHPHAMTNPMEIASFYQQQQQQHHNPHSTFGSPSMMNQNFLNQQQNAQQQHQQFFQNQQMQQQQNQQTQQIQQQFQTQQTQLQDQLTSSTSQVTLLQQQVQDQDQEIQQLQQMIQDQRMQFEQELKLFKRDAGHKYEDQHRLKSDNQFLLDKQESLQNKLQQLKRDFDQQKEFYENALEQRFNQMEQFEEDNTALRQKNEELEEVNKDMSIKWDMMIKDKEDFKKKNDIKDREISSLTKKFEDAQSKLDEAIKIAKDKEQSTDKKVEENFSLKQRIDQQRQDNDKMRKKLENVEDQLTHKDLELKQISQDFDNFKKKQKFEKSNKDDDIRNELMIEKGTNSGLRDQIEHLQNELYDMRDKLSQTGDIQKERDHLRKEVQSKQSSSRTSNNNENQYMGGQEDTRQRRPQQHVYEEQSEIGWSGGVVKQQQKQMPPQRDYDDYPQEVNKKYNLPASFFQDNDYTTDQIMTQTPKKPLHNDRSNNIQQSRGRGGVQMALSKEDKDREMRQEQVKNVEQNLLQMQLEQKKLVAEFDRIPDNAKTIAQRRRKEDLDWDIKISNKSISNLKTKLRDMDALHR